MEIQQINVSNRDWIIVAEEKPLVNDQQQRFVLYQHAYNALKQLTLECDTECNCNTLERYMKHRIGSASANGQVFRIELDDGFLMALKFMPLIQTSSMRDNINELELATILSDAVKRGECNYFPLVYTIGFCHSIHLPTENMLHRHQLFFLCQLLKKWGEETGNVMIEIRGKTVTNFSDYQLDENGEMIFAQVPAILTLSAMVDTEKDNIRTQLIEIYGEPSNSVIEEINQMVTLLLQSDTNLPRSLPGHLLVSELANRDLASLLYQKRNTMTPVLFTTLLYQIVSALTELQSKHIIHYDFHLGNVLVLESRESYKLLIHDFGTSQIVSTEKLVENNLYDFRVISRHLKRVIIDAFKENPNQMECAAILEQYETYPTLASIMDDLATRIMPAEYKQHLLGKKLSKQSKRSKRSKHRKNKNKKNEIV